MCRQSMALNLLWIGLAVLLPICKTHDYSWREYPCDVYYENDLGDPSCYRESEMNPTLSSDNVLSIDCDSGKRMDLHLVNLSLATAVVSGDCILNPSFLRFLDLSNAEYFLSKQSRLISVLYNHTFDSLCKLKNITLSKNGIESVESEAFQCLELLEKLDMSDNMIESLPAGVFQGMHRLTELYLYGNIISYLPQELFDDLVSLCVLELQYNTIMGLPEEIFRYQTSLERLILSGNQLQGLSDDIFSNLTELVHLQLQGNELTGLENMFSSNGKIQHLDLSWNSGLILTNQTFIGLSSMEYLNLMECNLQFLPSGLFAYAVNLSRIGMRGNNLEELCTNTLMGLQNVQEFYLENNLVSKLEGSPFKSFGRLEILDLQGNLLPGITFDSLQGLSSIVHLNLSSNVIRNIDSNSFDHMVNLQTLNTHSNAITSLHGTSISQSVLSKLTQLKHLDLTNNKLRRLTNVFVGNGKLHSLALSRNSGLELDDGSFKGLFAVKYLYVDACDIGYLPSGVFADVQKLEELHLQNNNLQEIAAEVFGTLKDLQLLYLDFNGIAMLPDRTFLHNENIQRLHLTNNNLSLIKTDDFLGLSSLYSLDISSNSIGLISDGSLDNLPKLTYLNISHNYIPSLGSALFEHNEELFSVDASHNRLTDIRNVKWYGWNETWVTDNEIEQFYLPAYVKGTPAIHLERNYIGRIRISVSSVNRSETDKVSKLGIYLGENLLLCDCHAYELYAHVKENPGSPIEFVGGLHCQFPKEKRGKPLTSFNYTEFMCDVTDSCPVNCSCPYTAYDGIQVVRCSGKAHARLPVQAPPNTNVLYIDRNNLTTLAQTNESVWQNLTSLHAENNYVADDDFFVPENLTFLGLRNNRMKSLPPAVQRHAESVKEFQMTVSGNPWPCDCSVIPLKLWIFQHASQVVDVESIRCTFANGSVSRIALTATEDTELCPELDKTISNTASYVIGVTLVAASTSVFVLYFRYRLEISSLLFTHFNGLYLVCRCCSADGVEMDKVFDCFISYGSADQEVAIAMLEELEYKPPHYKFCIHERNWVAGRLITDNIIDSVQNSRKTVIVLSETFLKSEWFQTEFQVAYHQTLQDRKDRLIFVLKGELPDISELHADVQLVLSSKTYLRWGERWFWEKLRYAIYVQKHFVRQNHKRREFRELFGRFLWQRNRSRPNIAVIEEV